MTINGSAITTRLWLCFEHDAELALAMDLSADYTTAAATVSHSGAVAPATCRVTYAAATATVAPTYTTVTTGC